MALRISSVTDLRLHVSGLAGSEATDDDIVSITANIMTSHNRPGWGSDWTEFFDAISEREFWAMADQPIE